MFIAFLICVGIRKTVLKEDSEILVFWVAWAKKKREMINKYMFLLVRHTERIRLITGQERGREGWGY